MPAAEQNQEIAKNDELAGPEKSLEHRTPSAEGRQSDEHDGERQELKKAHEREAAKESFAASRGQMAVFLVSTFGCRKVAGGCAGSAVAWPAPNAALGD